MTKRILFPHSSAFGGPGSFQSRFEEELSKRNWKISYPIDNEPVDVILIVGGTGKIFWLLKQKLKGIPIVYRLDGINWLHKKRRGKRNLKNYLEAEKNNFLLKIIHSFFADKVIYQSVFVKDWWHKKGWTKPEDFSIIYNSINLNEFRPINNAATTEIRLVCLEGYLDYSPFAIELINELNKRIAFNFEVYGEIKFEQEKNKLSEKVDYKGRIDKGSLPRVFTNSIYLSLDIHPACPNTVIEALACGAPVVAFDTGSLKELVTNDAGIIVPYGSDPWALGYPDVDALMVAIKKVFENYQYYSHNARKLAEDRFSIQEMTNKYIHEMELLKKKKQ